VDEELQRSLHVCDLLSQDVDSASDDLGQTRVGQALRSRIASVQMAVVEGGPRLGGFESGALAATTSTEFSILGGGIVALGGALIIGTVLPSFRRYRRPNALEGGGAAPG
jgi:hypothetical protein